MFQVLLFFHYFFYLGHSKLFIFIFLNYKKLKGFLQRILQEIMKKNNAWNIRRLVDDSFGPSSHQHSVIYCKLTDFMRVPTNDVWCPNFQWKFLLCCGWSDADSTAEKVKKFLEFFNRHFAPFYTLGSSIYYTDVL